METYPVGSGGFLIAWIRGQEARIPPQAIAEALERNRTLVELVLNKNNIGQQGTEVPQRFFSDRLMRLAKL